MSESARKKRSARSRSSRVVKKPRVRGPNAKGRKKPEYKSFKLHKTVKRSDIDVPSWRDITKKAFALIGANKKQIAWFLLVYGALYVVFVRGIVSPINVDLIKADIQEVRGDSGTALATNITVMSVLLQSIASTGGELASLYQVMFLITGSLALIWLFRQQQAGHTVTMRDAYYKGMYPLVPFTLVFVVILLQFLPALLGNILLTIVITGGIAVTAFEQLIWVLLFFALLVLSLYMVSSSLIALFIVTLPDMTPMRALRKAKRLVTFRHGSVLRKCVALVFVLGLLFVGLVLPAVFISSIVAQVALLFVTVFTVPFAVAYLFVLYRELL